MRWFNATTFANLANQLSVSFAHKADALVCFLAFVSSAVLVVGVTVNDLPWAKGLRKEPKHTSYGECRFDFVARVFYTPVVVLTICKKLNFFRAPLKLE